MVSTVQYCTVVLLSTDNLNLVQYCTVVLCSTEQIDPLLYLDPTLEFMPKKRVGIKYQVRVNTGYMVNMQKMYTKPQLQQANLMHEVDQEQALEK